MKHQFAALQLLLGHARLLADELLSRFYTFQPAGKAPGKCLSD